MRSIQSLSLYKIPSSPSSLVGLQKKTVELGAALLPGTLFPGLGQLVDWIRGEIREGSIKSERKSLDNIGLNLKMDGL